MTVKQKTSALKCRQRGVILLKLVRLKLFNINAFVNIIQVTLTETLSSSSTFNGKENFVDEKVLLAL
jgi:hypothetical protein